MKALFLIAPLLCGFTTMRVGTTGGSVKWAGASVVFYVDASGINSMPGDSDIAAAFQAMEAWSTVPCSSFRFVNGGTTTGDPGQTIRFVHSAGSWPSAGGVVAYTAFENSGADITRADIFVNDFEFTWSRAGDLRSYDLQSVLTHELGHALGLQHSADPTNSMYWRGTKGSTFFRTLSADDKAGLCYLYPVSSGPCDGNEDCPILSNGDDAGVSTVCSGGSCSAGTRGYGEDCLGNAGCASAVCARFDGADATVQVAPGLCSQASCPCPNGDACAGGVCAPRGAACNSATCEAATTTNLNDYCMVGLDGTFECIDVCVASSCGPSPAECFQPVDVGDPGRCRTPGPKPVGDPCTAPSECATYICGVGLDGVSTCAAPDEVVDPPDPPPDTGGQPDGGDPSGGDTGGDGIVQPADSDDTDPSDPGNSVDGGCAASSPSFALMMGAIVVVLFAVQRTRIVRRIS